MTQHRGLGSMRAVARLGDEAWRRLWAGTPAEGDTVTIDSVTDKGHRLSLRVQHRNGRYRVVGVQVEADGISDITIDDLRLPVQDAVEEYLSPWFGRADGSTLTFGDPQRDSANAQRFQATQRRRITDELLAEVAAVYREAEAAGQWPTKAVKERFGPMGQSTAERWVRLAREAGLLPKQ